MLPKAELGRRFCEPPGCPGPPANLRTRERAGAPFPLVAAQTSVAHTSTSDFQSLVLERGRLRYLRSGPRSPVPIVCCEGLGGGRTRVPAAGPRRLTVQGT